MKRIICMLMAVVMCAALASCGGRNTANIWEDAAYTADTELGSGAKTLQVEVVAYGKAVTFTINTDKETLGDALSEHSLISGEKGPYGLYVKVVNGMTADYAVNKGYWSFSKDGEYLQSGVDSTAISHGDHYEITYTE